MKRNRVVATTLAVFAMLASILLAAPSANATTRGCYGVSCNGLDPSDHCSNDAITAVAQDVVTGLLELRYSPSCAANWGRFTPYWRPALGFDTYSRVTVWNPGGPSYGVAHHGMSTFDSTWSQMADGTIKACVGVELVGVEASGLRLTTEGLRPRDYSLKWEPTNNGDSTWIWGPCY